MSDFYAPIDPEALKRFEAIRVAGACEEQLLTLWRERPRDGPIETPLVRCVRNRDIYMAYGAPAGSRGYWSPYHREIVFYADPRDPARDAATAAELLGLWYAWLLERRAER